MTTYYLPRKESDWLDENGGKEKLLSIVRDAMNPDPLRARLIDDVPCIGVPVPVIFCPHCNVRLPQPGQSPCWHCGLPTGVK